MYYDNPTIQIKLAKGYSDLFAEHLSSTHRVYYHPNFPLDKMQHPHTIDWMCEYANSTDILEDEYWLANLVKINLWTASIREAGIFKPMLLTYNGEFIPETGSTRLMCADLIPELTHTPVFISCHEQYSDRFVDYQQIHTFNEFVKHSGANTQNIFNIRFTYNPDDYGIYWYEYNNSDARSVAPNNDWCVSTIRKYLDDNPNTVFDRAWFSELKFTYNQ